MTSVIISPGGARIRLRFEVLIGDDVVQSSTTQRLDDEPDFKSRDAQLKAAYALVRESLQTLWGFS